MQRKFDELLQEAVETDDLDSLKNLLNKKPEKFKECTDSDVLNTAIDSCKPETVILLIQHVDMFHDYMFICDALYRAITAKKPQTFKSIVKFAATSTGEKYDIDFTFDGTERNPMLHQAALLGEFEVAQCILDYAKCFRDPNNKDETPLYEIKNSAGDTPLHLAAEKGHTKILQLFEERGANVNQGRNRRNSVLKRAVVGRSLSSVKLLVEKGAHTDDIDEERRSALELARDSGADPRIVTYLEKQEEKIKTRHRNSLFDSTNALKKQLKEKTVSELSKLLQADPNRAAELLYDIDPDIAAELAGKLSPSLENK